MTTATTSIAAMTSVYTLAQTVASASTPPSAISIDNTVYVFYGLPAVDFEPQFTIAITDVSAVKQDPRYLGGLSRVEEFEISGILWGALTDASAANEQLCANFLADMYSALDAQINLDPTLGGAVVHSWLSEFELSFGASAKGRTVQVDFQIHCEALVS